MSRLLAFLTKFSWPLLSAGVGVAIGLLLKYPAGWNPPDSTLNLLGGLVGAVGSVAASFLVLKKQVAEVDRQRQEDLKIRANRAADRLLALQRAVALSLHTDLLTAKTFTEGHLALAKGEVVEGRRLDYAVQEKEWCVRLSLLPLPTFDHLKELLPRLGSLSVSVVHAYSEALRIRSLAGAPIQTGSDTFDYGDYVQKLASHLPNLIEIFDTAINELEPLRAKAVHLRTASPRALRPT